MNAVTPKYDTITPFSSPTSRPKAKVARKANKTFDCHESPKIAPPPMSVKGMLGQVNT